MELRYYLFSSLILMFFSYQEVTGRYCNPFTEFKCFWDGECIPMKMKCDGKHDCISGEDETEWFAGCKNCSDGKFHCHKDPDYLTCIDGDYTCDGMEDCLDGEDESFEFAKCKCKRDLVAAEKSGRIECGKPCKRDQDCRPTKCKRGEECDDKKCVCDHECGMSCVTITKTCPMLKMIPHLRAIKYIQRNRKTNRINLAFEPFPYGVEAHHTCEPGYVEEPSEIRMCHGRGNETWTREIVCAKSCPTRETPETKEKPICGMECRTDTDCDAGTICTCDGVCGRTCVNIDVDCGEAPSVENAYIEYTGEKFDRVAHYFCKVGFYVQEGRNTRKCTGSGQYEKIPIKCAAIVCSDPGPSITATGGYIISGPSPPYLYNYTVHFGCGPGQRLLGSKKRTCGSNGRWDGILTACDNIGPLERCPHPGVPIGGVLIQDGSDEDFRVGKWVEFKCNKSLVMIGRNEQECLVIKQWSGDGAPSCIAPRHSGNSPDNVIRKVYESAANVRAAKLSKAGRTVLMNSKGAIEVYFVIDLSLSITPEALRYNIDFATSLIKRLSANGITDKVKYGIVVFATLPLVKLDIAEDPKKTPEEVIELLHEIKLDIGKIRRRRVQYGTDLHRAFLLLDERMLAFSYQFEIDTGTHIKRHIFVFTDGNFRSPTYPTAKWDIELAYIENPPEFYSISSSLPECEVTSRHLLDLASEDENYVFIEDLYKLHQYVDLVTDVRIDYSPCGQAGEVGSIRKMVSLGRSIGGEDTAERAWPWQALITNYDESTLVTYSSLVGGGSLINDRWVLTASHLFTGKNVGDGWEASFVVSLGITQRPTRPSALQGSVKAFEPQKIYLHEDYNKLNGIHKDGTFLNDVALIKLGRQYRISKDGSKLVMPDPDEAGEDGSVDFTPYVRPVCLPCSPDSCVSKVLMKKDRKGRVLIKGNETAEEKCRIEYEFLMGKNDEGIVAVVATGFGHNATSTLEELQRGYIYGTRVLQQAVLKIEERDDCQNAVDDISEKKAIPDFEHIFDDKMLCATGIRDARPGQSVVDTCKGDSGGPLVREVRDETLRKSCFVQLGIVSWGYGCGHTTYKNGKRYFYPSFHTDVTKMMSWINKTMKNSESPKNGE